MILKLCNYVELYLEAVATELLIDVCIQMPKVCPPPQGPSPPWGCCPRSLPKMALTCTRRNGGTNLYIKSQTTHSNICWTGTKYVVGKGVNV